MKTSSLPTPYLTEHELSLRARVRAFLDEHLPTDRVPSLGITNGYDPAFSRTLASAGFVGMTVPVDYGGGGHTAAERFVVVEELLAAGAPIAAHWVADRQTVHSLLLYGSEEQRRFFLPRITRGECFFSIGMSEPDAGSDLAAVRTRAEKISGGWLVNGAKTWTSGAHVSDYMVVLCRTAPLGADRHGGLSQMIVDLKSDSVEVRPISSLDGSHHFNDVILSDVFVPDSRVLGNVGDGWPQVTAELAFERSGPDRWLSTFALIREFLILRKYSPEDLPELGAILARYRTVRGLSLAIARLLDQGDVPAIEAALVKDIGTQLEKDVVEFVLGSPNTELDPSASDHFAQLLSLAALNAPIFTIRGGTTEVLRTFAAKSLLRSSRATEGSPKRKSPHDTHA